MSWLSKQGFAAPLLVSISYILWVKDAGSNPVAVDLCRLKLLGRQLEDGLEQVIVNVREAIALEDGADVVGKGHLVRCTELVSQIVASEVVDGIGLESVALGLGLGWWLR